MTPRDPWFRNRKIRDAIYRAVERRMDDDPSVILLGEGAHMKMHFDAPGLEKKFPDRILTMPISEDGNSNFAVGLALSGVIPIVDVISSDFLFRTMDAICNTMVKTNYVAESPYTFVIRAEFLTGGPTTGQRIEGLFTGIPGIHVAVPSRPEDAEVMMAEALARKGVTVFFEDRMIEDATTPPEFEDPDMPVPARGAVVRLSNLIPTPLVTVVSYGYMARELEEWLAGDPRVELIDLRWVLPLDMVTVRARAANTGAILFVEPSATGLVGSRLLAAIWINETVPPPRAAWLCAKPATIPASRELHEALMPSRHQVLSAIERLTDSR